MGYTSTITNGREPKGEIKMKYNNSTIENIFRQPMTYIGNTSAWRYGEAYFRAAEAEEYNELCKDEIFILLHSAASIQHESGLLPLFMDPEMPSDARVDMIYRPSYAISAVAIYA